VAALAAFCAEHGEELARLLCSRSTQTNEIRRCVALRLGLSHVGRRWPGPLAPAEVGASAGLNLLFDRYRYRVGDHETPPAAASPVMISCGLRGGDPAGQILAAAPEITSRLGIDRQPVQLADPDARTAFASQLAEAARRRPIAWVFAEGPGLLATTHLAMPALTGPLAQRNASYLVGASLRGAGRDEDGGLALADPYLRWLALARHADDGFQWLSAGSGGG
jgi:hypothetical protein